MTLRHLGGRPLGLAAAGHPRDLEAEAAEAVRTAVAETAGDVLVFLPGEREIRGVQRILEAALPSAIKVLPLFGALPLEQQREAVSADASGARRIILSTTIAESSLTIEGVRAVVDCGLRRASVYEPATGMAGLRTVPISAAAATQRAGRAGRLAPGTAYRLWSEGESRTLKELTQPAIAAADLAPLSLQLAACGHADADAVGALPWLTPPPAPALQRAHELLVSLGALTNASSELQATPYASELAELPLHPRLAHLLRGAADGSERALAIGCAAAAVLAERDVLQGGGRTHGADLRLRLRALQPSRPPAEASTAAWWRARREMADLHGRVEEGNTDAAAVAAAMGDVTADALPAELLARAFPDRIAQRQPGKRNVWSLSNGRGAALASESDALSEAEYLVAPSLDGGDKRSARMQLAAPLTADALRRALDVQVADEIFVVPSDGSVRRRRVERIGAIVLSSEPLPAPSAAEAAPHLLAEIQRRGLGTALVKRGTPAGEATAELVGRVALLRALQPEAGWPVWSESALAEDAEAWLLEAVQRAGSLKALASKGIARPLEATLSDAQRAMLAAQAPTHLPTPAGRKVALRYAPAGDVFAEELEEVVVLSSKLQEWLGTAETPTVGGPPGRYLPVTLELLSPAERPVARTSDLQSFWAGPYAGVRVEMKAKYPKHPWPEDGMAAEATRLTKKGLERKGGGEAKAEAGGGASNKRRKKKAAKRR